MFCLLLFCKDSILIFGLCLGLSIYRFRVLGHRCNEACVFRFTWYRCHCFDDHGGFGVLVVTGFSSAIVWRAFRVVGL